MKSRKYKALLLILCSTIIPLLALNLWITNHYSLHLAKVLPLLVALLVSLGLNLFSASSRGRIPPILSHRTLMTPFSSIGDFGQGEAPFLTLLQIWTSLLTMGTISTMVFWVNPWLSLLLLVLVPLDVICRKFLYQELIWLSNQRFPAFQEIAATQQYRHLFPSTPRPPAPAWSRILYNTCNLARGAIVILAIKDFIFWGFHPPTLILYCAILFLYFSSLGAIVHGSISMRDLVNSIKYLRAM